MKIVNKKHLFKVLLFHAIGFVAITSFILALTVISHDKKEVIAVIVNPALFDKSIYQVSMVVALICFSLTTISLCLSMIRILGNDYILLYEDFVEGPTESGERIVLSKAQLKHIGLNLLGQFSLQSGEGMIVLPGNADLSLERELKNKIKNFFNTKSQKNY